MYKDYKEMAVEISAEKAFSIVKDMINEQPQIVISFFGIERDDNSIYGRVYGNNIIYYNRPKYTQGITYKTILTFENFGNGFCKIIAERTKIIFYALLWAIMTVLSFAFFSIPVFITNSYTITTNNIPATVNGHPYFMYIFPVIISIAFFINIYLMYLQRDKSTSVLGRIIYTLKQYEEN